MPLMVPKQCLNCLKSEQNNGVKLMTCSSCRWARFCGRECMKAAWPSHKVACKAGAAMRQEVEAQRDALHANYKALTNLPISTFPRALDPKAVQTDLRKWSAVHRGSLILAATEGLSVYIPNKSKAFSHCMIFTLVERPGFDHDSAMAAELAPTRFIISDIAVKDFDTARSVDLIEHHWESFDRYRKFAVDSRDADPVWMLLWLVCTSRTCPFLLMMPISISRKELTVNGPSVVANPLAWEEVVCGIKEAIASGKAMER